MQFGKVVCAYYEAVSPNNPTELKAALAQQPVSVAIEADKKILQQYTEGIIIGDACGTELDHAVLAVGYGEENGVEYFLVKNSWGAAWGDKGYFKVGIESGKGVCGIN
jgi:C1A family cysteine protease